ncbi:MAG: glycosyltransferase family 39 protein, partial [Acidobacteriota bacterium]
MRSSASLISDKDRWPRLALIVLAVGVASRAWGYLSAGSLWLDELFLASSFRHLSYQELLGPLRDSQTAPVAWLWIEKTVWNGLGSHELALRLPSLVASILTLPLTFLVARRLLRARWAVLPLFLVAVSPYAVWQAFQVKPYSFDLLVAVTLAWFAIAVLDRQIWAWPSIAVVGTVAVFVSMPSIFVLVAIVVVLVAATILDRSQTRPRWIVI